MVYTCKMLSSAISKPGGLFSCSAGGVRNHISPLVVLVKSILDLSSQNYCLSLVTREILFVTKKESWWIVFVHHDLRLLHDLFTGLFTGSSFPLCIHDGKEASSLVKEGGHHG